MPKNARALIIRKKSWGDYHLLVLKSPLIARLAQPGQFLMVRVGDRPYPLLRRPFSIHSRGEETLEIFFAKAGEGTTMLAEKKAGESLDILGPLGKGFSIPRGLWGKTAYLIGGGRGIAPLHFLAQELRLKSVLPIIFYGGKTEADVPLLQKFAAQQVDVFVSTDDGSHGFHGFASAMLERKLTQTFQKSPSSSLRRSSGKATVQPSPPAHIYACGPDPMMKRIAEIAARHNIPAQFSLESVMGCGIGACWGCVKKIKRGEKAQWVKICEEGPVFEASEIVWEEQDEAE